MAICNYYEKSMRSWPGRMHSSHNSLHLTHLLGASSRQKTRGAAWKYFIPMCRPMANKRPNQTLERTTDRREDLFSMTSALKPEAQLAVVSGRSAFSR